MKLENISRWRKEAFFRYPFVIVGGDRLRKIDMINILFIQKTNAFWLVKYNVDRVVMAQWERAD